MTRRRFPLPLGRREPESEENGSARDRDPAPNHIPPPDNVWAFLSQVVGDERRVDGCVTVICVLTFPLLLVACLVLGAIAQSETDTGGWALPPMQLYPLAASAVVLLTVLIRQRVRRVRRKRAAACGAGAAAEPDVTMSDRQPGRSF
jgi:hypothetical protein